MKKLLSRGLIVMLTAALLVTAALVTSCDGAVGKIIQGTEEDDFIPFNPPAGMGYIRIRVANGARTVSPGLPDPETLDYRIFIVDSGDGTKYDSDEADLDDDGNDDGVPVAFDDLADLNIVLEPGTGYKVTVTAYNPGTTEIIGMDVVTGVDVTAGVGTPVDVKLKHQITGSGEGKFSYNIALPSNIGIASGAFTAVLDVKNYPAKTNTSLVNIDLTSSANRNNTGAPATLDSGYYLFTITMIDPGVPASPGPEEPPALQKRTVTHILHIYDNLITDFGTSTTPEQLADLNVFSYTVTYDEGDGEPLVGTAVYGPLAHGSTLNKTTQAPTASHLTLPFGFWSMTVPATARSVWYFDDSVSPPPTKLIKDVTLTAIYTSDSPVTIDIDWDRDDPAELENADATWTQDAYYNSSVVQTCTISFDDLKGYTIFAWAYDGGALVEVDPGEPITQIVLNTLTGDIGYMAKGFHTFTVILKKAAAFESIYFILEVE